MQRFFENNKGSISIFLVLMILPMFTLAGITIDGSRIIASKSIISDSGDLTINAALTEYDEILKDVYGLFGISKSTSELESNLYSYFQNSLSGKGDSFYNFIQPDSTVSRAVDLRLNKFRVEELKGSELTNPVILERQIQEFMKYRGIISAVNGIQTNLFGFSDLKLQSAAISSKIDFDRELNNFQNVLNNSFEMISKYNNGPIKPYCNENSSILLDKMVTEAIYTIREQFKVGTFYQLASSSYKNDLKVVLLKEIPKKSFIQIQTELKTSLDNSNSESIKMISYFKNFKVLNFNDMTTYLINLNQNTNFMKQMFFNIQVYEKSYNEYLNLNKPTLIDSDLKSLEEEHNQRLKTKEEIVSFYDKASSYQSNLKKEAFTIFTKGKTDLVSLDTFFKDRCNELQNAIASLRSVLKQCKQIKDGKVLYKKNVDQLTRIDLKNTFSMDLQENAEKIEPTQIDELISVLEKNKSIFYQYSQGLKNISFYNQPLLDKDIKTIIKKIKPVGLLSINDLISNSQKIIDKNLIVKSLFMKENLIQINKSVPFFNYLNNIMQSKSNEFLKKEAETKKGEINKLANKKITSISNPYSIGPISTLLPSNFNSNALPTNNQLINEIKSDFSTPNIQNNIFNDINRYISNVSSLTDIAIEKLLLEEYITEMFSCYSDDTNLLNLNGFALNPQNNVIFKNEVEYILWGNDVVEKNVTNTMNLLLGIRFLLNSSYAFSSPDIRAMTTTLATSIAGWTVFGVPLIQTALTLAFALAESKVDIENLRNGKSVPVIKNSTNWKCSIGGMSKTLLEETQKIADKKISNVFTLINNFTIDKTDELIDSIDYFTTNSIQNLIDSKKGEILNPIRFKVTSLIKNPINISKENVSGQINLVFNDIRKSIEQDQNDNFKQPQQIAFNFIESNYKQMLIEQIVQIKSRTDINNILNSELEQLFEQINISLSSKLTSFFTKVGDSFKSDVSKVVLSNGENVKEIVREKITNFSKQFSSKQSMDMSPLKSEGRIKLNGFAFTYKDYLKLFITLGLLDETKKREMISRVASIIQINISKGKQNLDDGKCFQKNPNFNLSKRFTFIKLDATVGVKTNFIRPFYKASYPSKNFNLSNVSYQYQSIPFKTVGGY